MCYPTVSGRPLSCVDFHGLSTIESFDGLLAPNPPVGRSTLKEGGQADTHARSFSMGFFRI